MDKKQREKYNNNFKEKEKEALKQALATREFEIELYWKRTTYFWTLIAAILAGFGVSVNVGSGAATPIILSCIASVLCWAWILVNKGSKAWQENWEKHVVLLEDSIIGPLYKTVLFKQEGNFFVRPAEMSVSKINLLVSWFMLITCVSLLIYAWLGPFLKGNIPFPLGFRDCIDFWFCAGFTVISVLACVVIYLLGKSSAFESEQSTASNCANPPSA